LKKKLTAGPRKDPAPHAHNGSTLHEIFTTGSLLFTGN